MPMVANKFSSLFANVVALKLDTGNAKAIFDALHCATSKYLFFLAVSGKYLPPTSTDRSENISVNISVSCI